jgi:multisubunit Na+/H+ antiporter MnhB subunit
MRLRSGERRQSASLLRTLLRPPGRQANRALLVVLLFAFGTEVATVAIGSPDGAWVAVGHGICGMALVLLITWKFPLATQVGGNPLGHRSLSAEPRAPS